MCTYQSSVRRSVICILGDIVSNLSLTGDILLTGRYGIAVHVTELKTLLKYGGVTGSNPRRAKLY